MPGRFIKRCTDGRCSISSPKNLARAWGGHHLLGADTTPLRRDDVEEPLGGCFPSAHAPQAPARAYGWKGG